MAHAAQAQQKDSVSIWFVRQALLGLRARGDSGEAQLERAGIPPRLLASDQSRVSASSFGALWLAVAATLDDEFFGLDARRMKVGSFALLCQMCVQSPDLRHALTLACRYFNVLLDDNQVRYALSGDELQIDIVDAPGRQRPEAFRVFAHETLLIMLQGLLCWLAGRRIAIRGASFAYPPPVWWHEYRSMYACDPAFDGAVTRLRCSARVLEAPVVQNEQSARRFLREAPHNFIVRFKDPRSCQARIRRRLRNTPPDRWPGFAELAVELGMAASTLHRRLEREGTSFRSIRDALRRDLAIDRLVHTPASVAAIATDLGFAEPSAFHRAFKQWTGLRPGDYRQREAVRPDEIRR